MTLSQEDERFLEFVGDEWGPNSDVSRCLTIISSLKARVEEISDHLCLEHNQNACPGCVDDLRKVEKERDAAIEVLKQIAKPRLGGKEQQWMAQEFLSSRAQSDPKEKP